MSNIIDSSYETLTVIDNNKKLLIRNINEYNIMKYQDFKGERIIKKLGSNCEVIETFNDGIFNIRIGDHKLQSHNKIEVCKRLRFCIDNDTIDPLVELLKDELEDEINKEFFNEALKPFEHRIKIENDGNIIIDNIFMINKNGQAHYLNKNQQWKFLCIVAGSQKFKHMLSHALGKVELSFRTKEIYFKVLFLLYPDKKDHVFYNQLPKYIKEII